MAAPNLGIIPTTQGVQIHFWNRNEEAHFLIRNLYHLPANHSQEDIVDHVWVAICRLYFPHTATGHNGTRWTVLWEAYRGPPHHLSEHKPNVLVVRLQPQQVVGGLRVYGRDYLWVECKPPSHDTPSGWKNLINEATERLNSAHPQRAVAVIVAIGCRMMAFWWDPTNTVVTPRMSIQAAHPQTVVWDLDPRLKSWFQGGWVDSATGRVDLSQALAVDCITEEIVNGQRMLRWRDELAEIEKLLVSIRHMGP
ncbi:predicted protein [Histoplasma capsulatum H143]|uniref:Uncharacterized protein n=1 Tax=Ajellomyces capsulatus (strain H143) TaxID=544712 RepID=C6HI07_AJECH|nr:predicted protein [Histoplasma capsulatum H143]